MVKAFLKPHVLTPSITVSRSLRLQRRITIRVFKVYLRRVAWNLTRGPRLKTRRVSVSGGNKPHLTMKTIREVALHCIEFDFKFLFDVSARR